MGCCCSTPDDHHDGGHHHSSSQGQQQGVNLQPIAPQPPAAAYSDQWPTRGFTLIPPPLPRGEHWDEFEVTGQTLHAGLRAMAARIPASRPVTIVVMGGVVNTLYLRTRQRTRDVDFLSPEGYSQVLTTAAQGAREDVPELGGNWFNNAAGRLMRGNVRRDAYHAAEEQGVVLFQEGGLRVLVAQWLLCFIAKLQKLAWQPETAQQYDYEDAAHYLQQHILLSGRPLTVQEIYAAAARYEKTLDMDDEGGMTRRILPKINKIHKRIYGSDGIVFE